jgi:protein tyrosine phosphatase (PTP) superfamily phosphohydrolase (DUF442 family)
MASDLSDPAASPRARASLLRAILIGCMLGALLACAVEISRMMVDRNKHVVIPGRVYRSAQLNPERLDRFVREHNIRTVVNLRGRPFSDWYPLQAQATQALGISQEDVTTSANRLPPPGEIRRLIEIFDQTEYPILIHCQQGADRTGLATAAYLLLYTDTDFAAAVRQCSPRYGHVPIHTAASMDEFFDLYAGWLKKGGMTHTPANFRHWATAEYSPGPGSARLVLLGPTSSVQVGRPVAFTVRAYNTSRETWRLRAGARAGVHASYIVQGPDGEIAFSDIAGLMNADVPPGGFVDLSLPVPAPKRAGRYRLYVDLTQRNVAFAQYGSEPLIHDWEARDPAPPRGRGPS